MKRIIFIIVFGILCSLSCMGQGLYKLGNKGKGCDVTLLNGETWIPVRINITELSPDTQIAISGDNPYAEIYLTGGDHSSYTFEGPFKGSVKYFIEKSKEQLVAKRKQDIVSDSWGDPAAVKRNTNTDSLLIDITALKECYFRAVRSKELTVKKISRSGSKELVVTNLYKTPLYVTIFKPSEGNGTMPFSVIIDCYNVIINPNESFEVREGIVKRVRYIVVASDKPIGEIVYNFQTMFTSVSNK